MNLFKCLKKINKRKKNNFPLFSFCSYIFTFYFVTSTVLVLFIIICDYLQLPFSKNIVEFLKAKQNLLVTEKLQNLQNIYTAFFVGFIAAYFTVLSIFLGRKKKLGFKTCLKYIAKTNCLHWNVIILFINFFLIEFSFPVFDYSPFVELYTEDAILHILLNFSISIYNMTYMEDEKKASELLRNYLNHKNNKDFFDCYNDFVAKSFPKEKFSIYLNAFDKIRDKNKLFLELTKNISDIKNSKAHDLEGFISVLIQELYDLLALTRNSTEVDFNSVQDCYNLLYGLFLQYSYLDNADKTYLLKTREPLYFFIENRIEKSNISKEIEGLFDVMLNNFKQILIVSFHHRKADVVNQEISAFLEMKLPLQLKNFSSKIINKHTKYTMDLITWIFNLLQFKKLDKVYLAYIPGMLEIFEYDSITIFDVDSELYDKGVNSGVWHTNIYNRNYYIAILLLYCKVTSKYPVEKLIKKIKYVDFRDEKKEWAYKNILSSLNNIIKSDFVAILPDYIFDFEKAKTELSQILSEIIKNLEKTRIKKLHSEINYEKVKTALNKQKQDFVNMFSNFADKSEEFEDLSPLKFELGISWREIINDKSIQFYRNDYFPAFQEMLLNTYVNNKKQLMIKKIETFSDLPCDDDETIFISSKLYNELYKFKNFDFSNSSIQT